MNSSIPFKKRLALNVFREYRKTEIALHELQYLFWECTHRCNLKCIHCGSNCKQISDIPDMPVRDFLRVTEEIKSGYDPQKIMIVITGGEPLMRNDVDFCGAELKNQGYSWGIVTNGILLTRERLKGLIQAGMSSVTISLDGMETTHNWLRNSNCFTKVLDSIAHLNEQDGLNYDIVTCINQRNIKELEDIKELLVSMGVKRWRLFTISPIGRAKDISDLKLNGYQLRSLLEFIKMGREEKTIEVNYECEGFVGKYEMDVRDGIFFCRAGINIASVLLDGSVSACPNIEHSYSQGNIYNQNFLDIWNSRFQIMRKREWMKTGICEKCEVFKWCNGNGMHLRKAGLADVQVCQYNLLRED